MSCSVTERVTDNRAGVVGSQAAAGPTGATVTVTTSGCRLRGTNASNASLAGSPNSRGIAQIPSQPQNGPQTDPQCVPLRSKPCCLLWCCCCKCPCSNPGGKVNDENGPTRNSNNSDLLVNCEVDAPPTLEEIRTWGRSFDKLMRSTAGREIFRDFLRGEYSEENILFWLACEELKRETNPEVIEEKARIIYEDYISILSPKEVSLDSRVREIVNRNMVEPTPRTFDEAQLQIYTLMHRDSYPRFVNSPLYRSLSQQQTSSSGPQPAVTTATVTVSSAMFGGKLRSWMEAVRPRKKQHRKDKSTKIINTHVLTSESKNFNKREELDNAIILPNDFKENDSREIIASNASKNGNTNSQSSATGVSNSRYSANNLSSPESAYSTGYSTDGTSPGGPPDYLINNSSTHPDRCNLEGALLNSSQLPNSCNRNSAAIVLKNSPQLNHLKGPRTPILQIRENGETKTVAAQEIIGVPSSPSMGITSPRQRNRIRTNPWLPSNIPSPTPMKHYSNKATLPSKIRDSPSRLFLSTVISRRHSLSSSSCSSLSGTGLSLDHSRPRSASDEEDCTLNEMMGKYDESYVYEKETDILSDSDPTDCETDIDTGQDGGDEDEPFEGELDFIDNGSHLEFDSRFDRNTGHCSYYNYDNSKKRSSRRRTTRRSSKQSSEKKQRRSNSNKKNHLKQFENEKIINAHLNGSKSVGATPLSVRRADHRAISKLALEECLKRRSNSVSFYNNHINTIDKRDKEADLKYKELIVEAEQILRTMKTNGLSPRRIPGPANKRVEHLRITEGTKVDVLKYRPVGFTKDNPADTVFSKRTPSNHTHSGTRFSPKKSHITNFLINNSSIVVGKECEEYSDMFHISNRKKKEDNMQAQTNILHEEKNVNIIRASPRRKHYSNKNRCVNSSSDSDDELENSSKYTSSSCPQSEPVRRKVYFSHTTNFQKPQKKNKMVMFNLSREGNHGVQIKSSKTNSTDNLRQQVLLNTIANLKRNLEDQSASLKQVYRSSHNIYA